MTKIIYLEGRKCRTAYEWCLCRWYRSFIDQMASLLQTDASGLNEYAKNYKALYSIAARCGVFAKTDIQPLINDGAAKEDLAASIFQACCESDQSVVLPVENQFAVTLSVF